MVMTLLTFFMILVASAWYKLASPQASTPMERTLYQGKTAFAWHRLAVLHRVERDHARSKAGDAIRYSRRLSRSYKRLLIRRKPDVMYAVKLAATAFGVSERDMNAVASCESGHDPGAQNGKYRGVFQEGGMFEGGPFGHAGFSVWDPLPNAMQAAYTVAHEGWSQWTCKP